jgi:hypothetical protein
MLLSTLRKKNGKSEIKMASTLRTAVNEALIRECVMDLFVRPRMILHKWAGITEQTCHTKIGYVGQHLASVLLNVRGCKTGARGLDCMDGTEVKSCSRVDQSDKCKRCDINVSRTDPVCPVCEGAVVRNNDSKWLLTIRNQEDLDRYLALDRILLILEEYPRFHENHFDDISIRAFEIYPKRNRAFGDLLRSYYHDIFLKSKSKVPAPKNLWPHSFQFYMCDPVEIFSCTVRTFLTNPEITIHKYLAPHEPRTVPVPMPRSVLNKTEKVNVCSSSEFVSLEDKSRLSLR